MRIKATPCVALSTLKPISSTGMFLWKVISCIFIVYISFIMLPGEPSNSGAWNLFSVRIVFLFLGLRSHPFATSCLMICFPLTLLEIGRWTLHSCLCTIAAFKKFLFAFLLWGKVVPSYFQN